MVRILDNGTFAAAAAATHAPAVSVQVVLYPSLREHSAVLDQGVSTLHEGRGSRPGVRVPLLARISEWVPRPGMPLGGSGLGPASACGIVALHGDRIRTESLSGRGTVFLVSPPRKDRI